MTKKISMFLAVMMLAVVLFAVPTMAADESDVTDMIIENKEDVLHHELENNEIIIKEQPNTIEAIALYESLKKQGKLELDVNFSSRAAHTHTMKHVFDIVTNTRRAENWPYKCLWVDELWLAYCSKCTFAYRYQVLRSINHNILYKDGLCTVCGYQGFV